MKVIEKVLELFFELCILVIVPALVFSLSVGCFALNNYLLSYLDLSLFVASGKFIVGVSGTASILSFIVLFIALTTPESD